MAPLKSWFIAAMLAGIAGVSFAQTSGPTAVDPPPLPRFVLPNSLMARPGQTLYVDIWADENMKGLVGAHFILDFHGRMPISAPPMQAGFKDPLKPDELRVGTLFSSPLVALDVTAKQISCPMVMLSPGKFSNGPGWVVSFPLKVPENAPEGTNYALILFRHDALGRDNKLFRNAVAPTILTVDPLAPISGDVNGDGRVDIRDIPLALMIAVKTVEPTQYQFYAADVYPRDGEVKLVDVLELLRRITGVSRMSQAFQRDLIPFDHTPFAQDLPYSDDDILYGGSSASPF